MQYTLSGFSTGMLTMPFFRSKKTISNDYLVLQEATVNHSSSKL